MSDYEAIQRKHNIIVGAFVLVALCAFVWLVFKFGDMPVLISKVYSYEIYAQFPSAPGIQRDTPVRFCGYQVGRVTDVNAPKIMKDLKTGLEYHQIEIGIAIQSKYNNIPDDADIKLISRGLGSSYIEISYNAEKVAAHKGTIRPLQQGDHLQGATGVANDFIPEQTQKKLEKIVTGLDLLIQNANDIIGDPNNKNNVKATLANLAQASKEASVTLEKFQQFSDAGVVAADELDRTLKELKLILEKINTGEGTAAKFVNDGRLYEQLLENSNQLQEVLKEITTLTQGFNKKGIRIKL